MLNVKNNASSSQILLPMILAILGSIIMCAVIFLPYATATDEYAQWIDAFSDVVIYEKNEMTASDLKDVSMVEFADVYSSNSMEIWGNQGNGTMYVVLVALIGGFSLLGVLFASIKKPVALIMMIVLAFVTFLIQNWDYSDRGVIPGLNYEWGFGYYVFYAATAAAFIASIWMIVIKRKKVSEK